MDVVDLIAEPREAALRARDLREQGFIPAECYGAGKENVSFQMPYQNFRRAYIAAGENTVIDLKIGSDAPRKVLVQDVQYDPVSGKVRHVDFINVRMDKEVHTNIPLEFVGVAPAVKSMGGVLMTSVTELEVKCLPGDLVHSIEVDISGLEDFHTAIHVSDLTISDKITVLTDPARTIVSVSAPRGEEEEPEAAEGAEEGAEGAAEGGEAAAEGEASGE